MFCPNCGTKNIENALFCCNCGIKLENFAPTPAPAVEPEITPEVEATDNTAETAATTKPSAESEIPMESEVTSVPEVTVEPEETDTTGYSAPVYAPQRTPHKPVNPFMIVSFVEIVAFCIMIAVFFNVGQNTFGYENVAKNYFKSIADCDWDQVYNELELKESAFINKDAFLEMRKEDDKISYSKIKVESVADKNTAHVNITYYEKGSDYASGELQVKLTRQPKKSFLFFDNWKVSPDNYVVNDFTIYAP